MGSAGQHAVTLERSNPLVGVAEIFSQHLSIVFPEERWVELELVGKSREPHRKTRDLKLAENPIMNGSHRSAFEKMGMSHCFFDAQDGRVRDMRLPHDLHSRFISWE